MPHFSLICWPNEKPGVFFSTKNKVTSLFFSPVFAYTRYTSPVVFPSVVPFVIHILAPLSTHESPSFLAVVFMPRTSVPTLGSDMHIPPTLEPSHTAGSHFRFWASLPFRAKLLTKSMLCARYA